MRQNPYGHDWSAERPVVEGEYLAPERKPPAGKTVRGLGAAAVAAGVLFSKFKFLLLILLKFKFVLFALKFFASAGSLIVSIWFYALFWGWPFAVVFVALILLHELGHVFAMRFFGIPGSLPFFIPGFGALVTSRGLAAASPLHEAFIAYAGPLIGGLAALCCFLRGQATHEPFWYAAAYTGFFLNLFNLAPIIPLDGGRVVGAISPRIWLFGLVCFIAAMIAFRSFNPLILLLVLLSIPQAVAAWKGELDGRYASLTGAQRGGVAVAYFALVAFLLVMMQNSHVTPHRSFS